MKKLITVVLATLLMASVGECYDGQDFMNDANRLLSSEGYTYRFTHLHQDGKGSYLCYVDGYKQVQINFNSNQLGVTATYDANAEHLLHRAMIARTIIMALIGLNISEQENLDFEKGNWSYEGSWNSGGARGRQTDVWCDRLQCYVREIAVISGYTSIFQYKILQ
jgi:hypothetical protein